MEKKRFNSFAEYQRKQRQERKKLLKERAENDFCSCSYPMQIHSDDTECNWCNKEIKSDF